MPSLSNFIGSALLVTTCLIVGCGEAPQQKTPKAQPSVGAQVTSLDESYKTQIATLKSDPTVLAAFETIRSHREQNNLDLIELTEIPAPPFGETTRAQRVAEMYREAGLTDVTIDAVGNVIGTRPGRTGEKTIAIGAHLDTVFPIETDVTVRRDGDTYIAPGIGDNTRGIIVQLSLIKAMKAHDIETEHDLLFIGNIGEEGLGDLRGIKHLYRDGAPKIDSFIAIDGGSDDSVVFGGVGSYRYRVTFKGPGGHSWGDFGGHQKSRGPPRR